MLKNRKPKNLQNKSEQLATLSDFIAFAVKQFKHHKIYCGHGTDNLWDEAVYLILSALHLPLDSGQDVAKRTLTSQERSTLLALLKRRIQQRLPAAYLTHEAWFAGLPFYVNKQVLIPRSPLAELITKRFFPWVKPRQVTRILDIGTGSGCIAISCAYAFPKVHIDAVDVSTAALKVAARNCTRHQVRHQVHLIRSDLFTKLVGKSYDVIISNPPYVGQRELRSLPPEYAHEPSQALLAGPKGDEIIERIINEAPAYLSPRGILVVEVGNSAPLIMRRYKHLPFTWLEFEHGEGEVFLLTREQLLTAT